MDYQQIVKAAGGQYRGEMTEAGHVILFDSPNTGSTLAMFAHQITGVDAVRRHIALSDAKFRLHATGTNLQRSINQLREINHVR